eukprot:jgi/Botrbrau1/22076/Bobra.0206s0004.1
MTRKGSSDHHPEGSSDHHKEGTFISHIIVLQYEGSIVVLEFILIDTLGTMESKETGDLDRGSLPMARLHH